MGLLVLWGKIDRACPRRRPAQLFFLSSRYIPPYIPYILIHTQTPLSALFSIILWDKSPVYYFFFLQGKRRQKKRLPGNIPASLPARIRGCFFFSGAHSEEPLHFSQHTFIFFQTQQGYGLTQNPACNVPVS